MEQPLNYDELKSQFKNLDAWGLHASIDLYNCNPEKIRDANTIKEFVSQLCKLIDMKRFGKTTVVNFGEDEKVAGFSMTQLIETSLISGHFANSTSNAYLDVFSCKLFDPYKTAEFARKFFEGYECIVHYTFRI